MASWLEEAEKRQEDRSHRSQHYAEKIQQKKNQVKANFIKNEKTFTHFISVLNNLTDRVNALPWEDRQPFKKIITSTKKSKLDNKLHIFSSSKRLNKRKNLIFIPWLKKEHYKHIRVIYFCISNDMDMIEIEIRETELIRERLKQKAKPEKKIIGNTIQHRQKHHQVEEPDEGKMHALYNYPFEKLDEQNALEVIEWLAFRKDMNQIAIYKDISEEEKIFLKRGKAEN